MEIGKGGRERKLDMIVRLKCTLYLAGKYIKISLSFPMNYAYFIDIFKPIFALILALFLCSFPCFQYIAHCIH